VFDRSKVSRYIQDYMEWSLPEAVKRDLTLPDTDKVVTIFGPRRCGKTFYLFQLIGDAIAAGVEKENLLYLNMEDTRLSDLDFRDLEEVLALHYELHPRALEGNLMIFLDEPQLMTDWERAVRSLHDKAGSRLYLTGSSAKLLSREIATSLRGRTLPFLLLPYSFREFLEAKGGQSSGPEPSTAGEARMKTALGEFIRWGGFPEVVAEPDEGMRMRQLMEYYRLVIYRDIVERFSIENLTFIKFLLGQLFSGFSREMSGNKIFNTAKSRGFAVSKKTAYEYISYVEDAMAVFLLRRWSESTRTRETSLPKAYIADNGFARLFPTGSEDISHLMENAVYLQLRRAQDRDPLLEVYYWKDSAAKVEVDFVLRRDGRFFHLVQVCYLMDDPKTEGRELRALLSACKDLGCDRLTILNWDVEGTRVVDGHEVELVPLWKWLIYGTDK
jgi:predicted AAA+ superfamily ATPase